MWKLRVFCAKTINEHPDNGKADTPFLGFPLSLRAAHFEGVFSPASNLAAFGGVCVCVLLEDGCNFAGATFINIFVV